jgi:hypothetical protein
MHVVTGRSQAWVGTEYRSSSGATTVFAASGLRTHVVTGRSQVWVEKKNMFMLSVLLYVRVKFIIALGIPLLFIIK